MNELSERCIKLRHDMVDDKSMSKYISLQWSYWNKLGEMSCPEEIRTNNTVKARGIASVIENSIPFIRENELIVGYNFGDGEYGPWNFSPDIIRSNGFTDEQIEIYKNLPPSPYKFFDKNFEYLPHETELIEELAAVNSAGCYSITCNHSVIGYEKVLKLGFTGLLNEVDYWAEKNGGGDFYEGLRIICRAGCSLGEKYAAEAEKLIKNGAGSKYKEELKSIADTCRRVPRYPAGTFVEAVQSLWFAHIINTWEDEINANSLGRLDKILYPYYKRDVEAGILTEAEAFEILCCLWIKLYRDYDVQQSCVGGISSDGNPDVNELSYLMLDVTEKLNFIRCLSVRFDKNTERRFIKRALEVARHIGKGIPFFFNDGVLIPALIDMGVECNDAYDYAALGCVETLIPGKTNPHAVNSRCNFLKAIEYALNDGGSMITEGAYPGLKTGGAHTLDTYEKLRAAVFTQIDHMLETAVRIAVMYMEPSETDRPKPVKSLLTEGCMESGRDFNSRGAKYDYYQLMFIGIPNLADSLAAVKKLIYDEKKYTLEELIYQLKNDYPDEAFRLEFINKAPKFGNDDEYVDKIAYEIFDYGCDRLKDLSRKYDRQFHAQPFSFLWMIDHGSKTAATPDGRKNGEILAYSMAPMQGRDAEGLTALLNSISNLPTKKAPGSTSAIVEVDPKLINNSNIEYLTDILLSAAAKGLCNIQFNTVDADTLIKAQKNPENYKNLAVRVSGFSQKFNLLDKKLQDHIIARTKHVSI